MGIQAPEESMRQHTPRRFLLTVCALLFAVAQAAATVTIDMAPDETGVALQQGSSGGEVLVVTVSEIRLDSVEIDGQPWAVVRVPGGHNLMFRGQPSLPYLTAEYFLGRSGGIELEFIGATIRQIDLEAHGLAGVAPSKGHFGRDVDPDSVPWSFDSKIYGSSDPYPSVEAWLDDPFIAGPIRAQASRIPVIRWRASDNVLLVLEDMRFRIVPTSKAPNPRLRPDAPMTGLFEQLARRMVNVGPAVELDNPFVETGHMLIIADDDFLDEIQPLVDWQTRVGYPTTVAPTSVTGTTTSAIKSYIQSVYDQPESLAWIILVGDSQQIPTLTGVNSQHSPCDPCYTKLEGNDNRPDAAISRISAQNGAQVTTQVAKILAYEGQPDQGSAGAWYEAGMGVASNDSGGSPSYYDWERMDWLRTDLLDPAYTYTEFDQIYDPGASAGHVTTAIEEGRGVALYIGHGWSQGWVTTGFDTADAGSLTNGDMLPVIWSVACNNGEFPVNECFAEAWLRNDQGGAVSFEGGTTTESWVPPCDAQRGIVDALRLETAFTTGGQHMAGKHYCMDINGDSDGSEGNKWVEQSTLFGSPTTWMRTRPAVLPDEPDDFSSAGGVASLTVKVAGQPLAKANAAIVSFYETDGSNVNLLGSGLIDAGGMVHAAVLGDPTHCHIHGFNLVPSEFELAARDDGRISLDAPAYGCGGTVTVRVTDANVPGSSPATIDTVGVTLSVPGSSVGLTLAELAADRNIYSGTAVLGSDLAVVDGELLTGSYVDDDDGAGGTNVTKTDQASIDCAGPQISGVGLVATEGSVTVAFATSEPGTTVVRYGTSVPPTMVVSDPALGTAHTMELTGLDPCTTYFIGVESADALGNITVDTNGGLYYGVETMGWQIFLAEAFDSDPGWEIDNGGNAHGWAFGQPTGGGGDYGNPDPTSGFTGDNVYGVNLSGDYDNNLSTDQLKLTTPSMDLSQATSVVLSFRRWLGVETPSYDHARLQVSVDGGSFATVWENSETMDGGSWELVSYDLTAQAAGSADVRIRWTIGSSDSSWQYAGWNVDDVVIEGAFPCGGNPGDLFGDGFEMGDCTMWSSAVEGP